MADLDATSILRAGSLSELAERARDLGLTTALRAPMARVLGVNPRAGRMLREVGRLANALGTDDVEALLTDGEALLAAPAMRGVQRKLFEHARTYLYEAARDDAEAGDDAEPEARGDAGSPLPGGNPGGPPSHGGGARDAGAPRVEDGTGDRPRTLGALHAWAEAHHVLGLLSGRLFRVLSEREPALFTGMVDPKIENAPIEAILTDEQLLRGSTRLVRRVQQLRAAAWRYLDEMAEEAGVALAEEAALGWASRPLPEDEARAELIRRVLAHRGAVRRAFAPRPQARLRPWTLEVIAGEHPGAAYEEPAESRHAFPIRVSFEVRDGPLEVRSTHSGSDADPYVLSACDALLHRLFDPGDDSVRPLVDAIRHPAWQRGLLALEAAVGADPDRGLAGPLGWWVSVEPRLEVRPVVQKVTRSGPGKPRPLALERLLEEVEVLAPPDRDAAELLDLAEVGARRSAEDALRLTARALARVADGGAPVFVDDLEAPGRLVRAEPGLAVVRGPGGFALAPALDGAPVDAAARAGATGRQGPVLFARPDERTLVFGLITPAYARALDVLARFPGAVPEAHVEALIGHVAGLSALGPVSFAPEVPRTTVPSEPTLVLRLEAEGDAVRGQVRVRVLDGGPPLVPGEGPEEAAAVAADRTLVVSPRDLAAERAWARAVTERLLGAEAAEALAFTLVDPEATLDLLDAAKREPGLEVAWAERGWQVRRAVTEDLRVEVKDRRDWFGLEGGVEVDGRRVALALLLDAARENRRYVRLGADELVVLEAALLERLRRVEPSARLDRGRWTVSRAGVAEVEALGEVAGHFEATARFRGALDAMHAAQALEPALPETVQATLRPYQLAGFTWLARLSTWGLGAVLADDMGLGKTLQTLSVLAFRREEGPALVVAPTSVAFNWAREAARFVPSLEVRRYHGAERQAALRNLGPGVVVVTSYGLLLRDAEALGETEWGTLVLDEAQAVKNATSQRAQAAQGLPARWRLALTGTPVENRLSELWSLFRVVEPGLFGGWSRFKGRFATPIERDGDAEAAAALAALIRPFVLRRTKAEVAPELPPRTDVVVDVELSEDERARYEDVRLAALAKLEEGDPAQPEAAQGRFRVLAALTRLRQLACHPRLDDPDAPATSAKLQRTLRLLEEIAAEGQQALVFSQFTRHLELVRAGLDAAAIPHLYLDGQTPEAERAARVDAFQAGAAPVFLISLKAGGTGLNLTAADNVLLLDPWWNPAVEDQATDRAHRIGRERPVTVYRLVARDTVEDAILALHADKRALVGQVLDGTGGAASMAVDELVGLIRGA